MQSTGSLSAIIVCGLAGATLCPGQPANYRLGSLESDQPQAFYADDPHDSWNRIFYCLFARTVQTRLSADFPEGAPFRLASLMGFPALPVSERTFERIEPGDRAIDPLYPPSVIGGGVEQALSEPRYSQLRTALTDALADQKSRSPVERALMQSDLWSAYDIIYRNQRYIDTRRPELAGRVGITLEYVTRLMAKLALSQEEISALQDNYAMGANVLSLPDLFSGRSVWIEVEWLPGRSHDFSADYRRAARVFVKPRSRLEDRRKFLNDLRQDNNAAGRLDAVALVTQCLLIDGVGNPVPTRITAEVQIRNFIRAKDGTSSKTEIVQYELSRRGLLTNAKSGGLVRFDENSPAYLPAAGNDYGFASMQPDGNTWQPPVLATLRTRCMSCHRSDIDGIITFKIHAPEPLPAVNILEPLKDDHGRYVAQRKTEQDNWKALRDQWARAAAP